MHVRRWLGLALALASFGPRLLIPIGAGASPAGLVTFPAADAALYYCDGHTSSAFPDHETELSVPVPTVGISTDFRHDFPGTPQPIRMTIIVAAEKSDGSKADVRAITGFLDTATAQKSAFTGRAPIVIDKLALGTRFHITYTIRWRNADDTTTLATRTFGNGTPLTRLLNHGTIGPSTALVCLPPAAPALFLHTTSGTVNQTLELSLNNAMTDTALGQGGAGSVLSWDGQPVNYTQSEYLNYCGEVLSFKIPAAIAGEHSVKINRYGFPAVAKFTVKPRIKITPNPAVRGSIVDVSLRGFGKQEIVQIRWQKGTGWQTVATVTTSNTGSANVAVTVPTFVPDGLTKVRADGATSAAQTNALQVQGGPFVAARSPLATTATPSPTPTPAPESAASATPTPEATPEATAEPSATPTAVVTAEPTEISTVEPTSEPVPSPTAEPVVTASPDTTAEPTAVSTVEATIPPGEAGAADS